MRAEPRSLGGGALARAWLEGDPAALRFYPGGPGDADAYRTKVEETLGRFDRQSRERVAATLSGGGPDGATRLERFVSEDGVFVTTGQQPGLFGGPLYTLYKGFTAAALAERLAGLLGRPVLPVFWIASEDHDWDEARVAHVVDVDNELHQIALGAREGRPWPALHSLPLTDEVVDAVDRLEELLPETDFSARWVRMVRESHVPGTTLPEAFEKVVGTLLEHAGVYFVQSHAPELKEASRELLLRELADAAGSESALGARGAALEEAGFELQVPLLEGATNLFLEGPDGRERLFRDGDRAFHLRRSGTRVTLDEVRARVAEEPGILSPNVLLRPVVEAATLPTVSYVAGPGEAAYLPQTAPLFERHGVGMPVTHPRAAFTVVESKVEKVLRKFDLAVEELREPHHELAGRLLRDEMPPAVRRALGSFRGEVARGTSQIAEAIAEVDPTLAGPVEHVRNQTFQLLDEVEKKVVQSLKREQEMALQQLRKAQTNLFPGGRPQERVLNAVQYLVRYGDAFLDRVREGCAAAVLPPADAGGP